MRGVRAEVRAVVSLNDVELIIVLLSSIDKTSSSKPNQSQSGGNRASIAKQCGGVATHGTFQPRKGRAAAKVIRFGISFAARCVPWEDGREWSEESL